MNNERGSHERDERWAYVALAALVAAYIVYRYVDTGGLWDFGDVRVSVPDIDLGRFGRTLPYLFAPLFAVLSELYRRRKAKAMREDWERRVQQEGFLRQQENVQVRLGNGASGKFQGDVRLTRVALYVIDRSWRREPTRLVFEPSATGEPVVQEVTVEAGKVPEVSRVRVRVGGAAAYTIEFESSQSEAWKSDLRSLLRVKRGSGGTPRDAMAEAMPEE